MPRTAHGTAASPAVSGRWALPGCVAGGSLAALTFDALPPAWMLAVAAAAGLLLLCVPRLRPLGAILLACCWSLWNFQCRLEQRLPGRLAGEIRTVTGQVRSIPQRYEDYSSFLFSPSPYGGNPDGIPPLLQVRWFRDPPLLAAGQDWRLELLLKPPWAPVNFQGMDRERWLFAAGIGALATVRDGQRIVTDDARPATLNAVRGRVFDAVASALEDPRQRGLVQALAVADRSGMSRADRRLLNLTGTAHLLAISGLHIGLAAGGGMVLVRAAAWLLPFVPGGLFLYVSTIAAGLAAATAYAALAGFGTSTVRALAMLLSVMLAVLCRRSAHPARPWLLALCAVLLIDPLAPLGAGFWFSFLAVAALLLAFAPRPHGWRWWQSLPMAQFAVMLLTLPVGVAWSQNVGAAAYFANLIAIPLVSFAVVPLVLAGTAALGLPGDLSADLSGWLWSGAGAAGSLLFRFLERVASLQGAPWSSVPLPLPQLLPALAGAALLLLPRGMPLRWLGLFLMLPLVLPRDGSLPQDRLELEVLDVGQGTAVLLRGNGHSLLYDSGPGDGGEANYVASVILPAIRQAGGGAPERILISHGDLDHAGGLGSLLAAFPGSHFHANLPPPGQVVTDPGASLPPCHSPMSWRWAGARLAVLHPTSGLPYLGNDSSCVLDVAAPGGRLLLPGDVSAAVEQRLLSSVAGRYDVLLVPHHGSLTSSSRAFLDAIRPRVAIATAGLGNRFDFPREEIRRRYEAAGARFWSTGDCGALKLQLLPDGRMTAASARLARPAIWRWPAADGCPAEAADP